MMIHFNSSRLEDYRTFLKVRRCPVYRFHGGECYVPDEYAGMLGLQTNDHQVCKYVPHPQMFDYQAAIAEIAIRKQKYAVFADCGLGKTLIFLDFARHAAGATGKKVLIVSPLMVCRQTVNEAVKFYGQDCGIRQIVAADLPYWLSSGTGIGVTNYDAIREGLPSGDLGGLILDESSMLKSHYGAWGTRLIEMGRGVRFKLCGTGTPAPNDRIEYANHAVFLDRSRTVNEFLATYFVNRGQTQNRWELKPHALRPFYRSLADWSVFLTNPATYGWRDNVATIPPIHVSIEDVPLTPEQRKAASKVTGRLLHTQIGGIGDRGKLSQIAKGKSCPSNKPGYIRDRIASWSEAEQSIVWCHYNDEQDGLSAIIPSVSMSGSTSEARRFEMLDSFLSGDARTLITKPKILGFGVNLQCATRHMFSGLKDSYEEYYQAVKRSNRIGSTKPLNVHIPVTELEYPFVENVLRKANRVEADTLEQEAMFKEIGWNE